MKRKYDANLDIVKACLALLVVSLHIFLVIPNPRLYPLLNPLTRLAVPTFFMLSSFFFFRKVGKSQKSDQHAVFVKTEKRYVQLYVFWAVLLMPITLRADRNMFSSMRQFFTQLLFNSTFADSWYIMALIIAVPVVYYLVAVQKRVAFDTSDFRPLLSYNKCIRNPGFQTFPVHLRNSLGGFIHGLSSKSPPTLF